MLQTVLVLKPTARQDVAMLKKVSPVSDVLPAQVQLLRHAVFALNIRFIHRQIPNVWQLRAHQQRMIAHQSTRVQQTRRQSAILAKPENLYARQTLRQADVRQVSLLI